MTRVCILGHFGFGKEMLNGQTIKTKNVAAELRKQFGENQVLLLDTHGGLKKLPRLMIQLLGAFRKSKNIIIFPAQNGVRIFVPLCCIYNKFFKRKLHYAVVGGWLPDLLKEKQSLRRKVESFDYLYVETLGMKKKLEEVGLSNVVVMANFKDIRVLTVEELVNNTQAPFRICTFSRVMKEKGIEDAIAAIKLVNEKYHEEIISIDIYGQIENGQEEWFDTLIKANADVAQYKGLVGFDNSVDVIKEYYALVFPTYYEGEGFAGTIIDAMASGVPVIASDWRYNSEFVSEGQTGVLFTTHNINELAEKLEYVILNVDKWNSLKTNCIRKAEDYRPDKAILPLLKNL